MKAVLVNTSTTARPHGLTRGQFLRTSEGHWLEVLTVPSSCEFTWRRLRWYHIVWHWLSAPYQ